MGAFYTNCRISTHADRTKVREVRNLLVDSGSEFSWIDEGTLNELGITKEEKSWTFVMANGTHVIRSVGFAIIEVEGVTTTDEIVFAQPGDLQLLGSRTLEGLNLRIDPYAKKLVAGGPILAALSRARK